MSTTIQLGDRVKDRVTGFSGIATGRTIWLNGCERFAVQSDKLKGGQPTEATWVDVQQLDVVKRGAVTIHDRKVPGGPMPTPRRAADPR